MGLLKRLFGSNDDNQTYEIRLKFVTPKQRTEFLKEKDMFPLYDYNNNKINTNAEAWDIVSIPVELKYEMDDDSQEAEE